MILDHMVDFYQFADAVNHRSALVCVAPNTVVASVLSERAFIREFGGVCYYKNERTGQIYIGIQGTRLTSRFRRLMREGGIEFCLVEKMPSWLVAGGRLGRASNWEV